MRDAGWLNPFYEDKMTKVTRVEVIDHRQSVPSDRRGRVFVALPATAELVYQDNGRTLKIFLGDVSDPDAAYKDYTDNLQRSIVEDQ